MTLWYSTGSDKNFSKRNKTYLGRTRSFFAENIWKMKCKLRYWHPPWQ